MIERGRIGSPALVVAVGGPLAGIALWYVLEALQGGPALALPAGAAVIFVAARATAALAIGRRPAVEPAEIAATLAAVGGPYAALVVVGLPVIVAFAIALLLGPPLAPRLARRASGSQTG